MPNKRFTLIIPAAGSGARMEQDLPKPYLTVAGKTILEHTVSRFTGIPGLVQIIIAVSDEYMEKAAGMFHTLKNEMDVQIVKGGSVRQHSIYNALKKIADDTELVVIHDAARPFVSREQILNCLSSASESGAAILGVPVRDTIKRTDNNRKIVDTPDRNHLWQAQTPQVFRYDLIADAYEFAKRKNYFGTDDASLVEFFGRQVEIVPGSYKNFKITYPLDLWLAGQLLNRNIESE